ncbi:MAG: hypothetical protein ABI321_09025 [Polyangia bacterium]
MARWGTLVALLACALTACSSPGEVPGSFSAEQPEALFLVHNELYSVRLDGTRRSSLGLVGDNRARAGWPRRLPDGRAIVLGDDSGSIYPYYQADDRLLRLARSDVSINDALCGVSVQGASRLILTATPYVPTYSVIERIDVDDPAPAIMHTERTARISDPAAYGEGRIVAVISDASGSAVVSLDVDMPDSSSEPTQLAYVDAPYRAITPSALPDGRVVYLVVDSRDVDDLYPPGDMWIIEPDGTQHAADMGGIVALTVVDDRIVFEVQHGNQFSDLEATNLRDPAVNLTNTAYASEHLGWSD